MTEPTKGVPIANRRVIVVTRLLPIFGKPVVTHVELVPPIDSFENKTVAEMEERYGNNLMNRVKSDFCSKFVEFTSAEWFWCFQIVCDEDAGHNRRKNFTSK